MWRVIEIQLVSIKFFARRYTDAEIFEYAAQNQGRYPDSLRGPFDTEEECRQWCAQKNAEEASDD